jgi:hypothetical protein
MKRSYGTVLGLFGCAACSETATLAERPRPAAAPAARPAPESASPGLPELTAVPRPGRPSEPVRIVEPRDGAEIDLASAKGLAIRVHGPARTPGEATLVLSFDGARPRPVAGETLGLAELVETGAPLELGAHDLVLAALGPNGSVLEPSAGGVASARFFVGPRPAVPPPRRFVCLSPFGTYYGRAPAIALDFLLVPPDAKAGAGVLSAIASAGPERRARAVGQGPFALGDFGPGDHEITLSPEPGAPAALPGRCVFAYNPEIERSP